MKNFRADCDESRIEAAVLEFQKLIEQHYQCDQARLVKGDRRMRCLHETL